MKRIRKGLYSDGEYTVGYFDDVWHVLKNEEHTGKTFYKKSEAVRFINFKREGFCDTKAHEKALLNEEIFGNYYLDMLEQKKIAGIDDKADCSVVALAICTNSTYLEAYEEMKKMGRKANSGAFPHQYIQATFNLGYDIRKHDKDKYNYVYDIKDIIGLDYVTSTQLKKNSEQLFELLQGRFYARVSHHVFAIVDGQVQDYKPNGKKNISHIWKVEK